MIDIEPSSFLSHPMCDKQTTLSAKKSKPFVESFMGYYAHRVRHVTLYSREGGSHIAVNCWCGMTICISNRKPSRLVEFPSQGKPICATCEGRAIGAGVDGSREIAGRQVMFSPRNQKPA